MIFLLAASRGMRKNAELSKALSGEEDLEDEDEEEEVEVSYYEIYRDNVLINTLYNTYATSYTDSSANYAVQYKYDVIVYFDNGVSATGTDEGFRLEKYQGIIGSGTYRLARTNNFLDYGYDNSEFIELYLQKGWTYWFKFVDNTGGSGLGPAPYIQFVKSNDLDVTYSGNMDFSATQYPEFSFTSDISGKCLMKIESNEEGSNFSLYIKHD